MPKFFIANWKSNKTFEEAKSWVSGFSAAVSSSSDSTIVVCPPSPLIPAVLGSNTVFSVGSQDVSPYAKGSYTGAVPAQTLKSLGVLYCIVGHSERRRYFAETGVQVAQKVEQLVLSGLTPIVCVDTPYISEQLNLIAPSELEKCLIAFEPQSAIGSGNRADLGTVKTAMTQIAQFGKKLGVVYGGSVTAESVAEYLMVCDGVLVGSASLDPASFASLVLS